jgi:signal transduction histidine kinase
MDKQKTKIKRKILASVTRFNPREFRRITREMYSQNLELVQVNKTLSLLNTIDHIVLQSNKSCQEVCKQITESMTTEYGTCVFAGIFCKHQSGDLPDALTAWTCDWPSDVNQIAAKEHIETMTPNPSYKWSESKDEWFADNLTAANKVLHIKPTTLELLQKELHVERLYATRLSGSQGVIGTLVVGLREQTVVHDEKLLGRVGEAIGMALDNKLLQEENQLFLVRLQRSNAKLRKLDETKDDFISMASHQLRTPLTSVKGYVSMVLDGDAGKITAVQRKLLEQSFISSQRMVYLISDLLNVSRLRTGKFVIDTAPSDLSEVIEQEVQQLLETVKSRDLELVYHKPAHFPLLSLDETKMRQVIMNFIDNAVYYTPRGGCITVHLVDKPKSIEFTVVDTGIGVPKHEHYRLFTKFFRAQNAQRARPDGTGLGLFMAKKVIIAQGGAIIFESKEGQGSTFGFTFAKSRLQAEQKTNAS